MSDQNKTCEELLKKGQESPCIGEIQVDLRWVKEGFEDFRGYYEKCHQQVVDRLDATNGRVKTLEKWMWALGGAVGFASPVMLYLIQNMVR